MRLHDPDGFSLREPSAKKVHRSVLVSLGPHHEWSADGHDKLSAIGFPIWGVRDKWSGKWLGLWVVPSKRLKKTVAYLYLKLVAELGGKKYLSGCMLHTHINNQECQFSRRPTVVRKQPLFMGLHVDLGLWFVFLVILSHASVRESFAPKLDEVGMGAAHVFLKSIYNITVERGWLRVRLSWGDNVKVFFEAGNGIYNPTIPKQ